VAFEFNSQSFQVLTNNLSNFSQQAQCVNAAISDFDGFAKFHADTDRLNDQEGSIDNNIESSGAGDTLVTILDNWWINQVKQNQFLVEKIIMLIEVHPQVLARTNNTPDDLFEAAEKCRAFDWIVPLHQNTPNNRKLSFFEQVPTGQYDVIGISR
jgi:hypothetical protein